jgi:hypothetical protein
MDKKLTREEASRRIMQHGITRLDRIIRDGHSNRELLQIVKDDPNLYEADVQRELERIKEEMSRAPKKYGNFLKLLYDTFRHEFQQLTGTRYAPSKQAEAA